MHCNNRLRNQQLRMTHLIIHFLRPGKVEKKFQVNKKFLSGFTTKKIQLDILFLNNFLMLLRAIAYLKYKLQILFNIFQLS